MHRVASLVLLQELFVALLLNFEQGRDLLALFRVLEITKLLNEVLSHSILNFFFSFVDVGIRFDSHAPPAALRLHNPSRFVLLRLVLLFNQLLVLAEYLELPLHVFFFFLELLGLPLQFLDFYIVILVLEGVVLVLT